MKKTLKRESKVLEIAEIEGMASSSGRGIPGRGPGPVGVAIGSTAFAASAALGPGPDRSPGLGQDGFGLVEKGVGKVAVPSGAELIDRRSYGSARIEARKHILQRWGLGAPCTGRSASAGCNASRRLSGRQAVRSAHLCVVWDPDEMVVIHPS